MEAPLLLEEAAGSSVHGGTSSSVQARRTSSPRPSRTTRPLVTTDSDDDLDSEPWDIELDSSALTAATAVRALAAERVQPIHRAINQRAENCLPCALLVCFCVPCVLRWWNPFPCCCRRRQCHSHPNDVPVPIDLFTPERMYSRPLAVVTYVCFTWQVFVAYFISIFSDWDIDEFYSCNDTRLTSPALDTVALLHYYPIESHGDCSGFCWTNVLSELSGLAVAGFWTPLIFLVAIGIGNSRWHKRCWAFVAPVVALIPMWATISVTWSSCLEKVQKVDWNVSAIENHDNSNGFLLGGTIVSVVASLLYTMQFVLAVGVVVSRGCSSDWNSRRITHCGGAEYRELPITPLEPMSPQAKSNSSALSVRGHPIPQAIDSTGTMDALAETPLKTPLRFWVALALSELVVGTLFILFISFIHLYGHVMEDYARAVKGHVLDLNEVVADIANLNGTDLSGVVLTAHRLAENVLPTWQQTILPNFTLVVDQFTFENIVRSATLGGGSGLINELYWKYRAHRTIRKVIEMPQGDRRQYIARFDLFRAYYYVPFAVFNSAFAFAVVTFLLTLMSFIITPWNMFPPYTRSTSTLWTNVLLPILLGPVLASVYVLFGHVIMKRVLFKGVIATDTSVRYQRLFRFMDVLMNCTVGPLSALTYVSIRFFLSTFYFVSSLARADRGLMEMSPTFAFIELGRRSWGGMVKLHIHSELARASAETRDASETHPSKTHDSALVAADSDSVGGQ